MKIHHLNEAIKIRDLLTCPRPKFSTSLLFFVSALFANQASALLLMEIDTINQKLKFTGSDSGNTIFANDDGEIQYYVANWGAESIFPSESVGILDLTSAISESTSNSAPLIGMDLVIDFEADASSNFRLIVAWNGDPGNSTLTGLGTTLDYSILSNGNRSLLESLVGENFPLVNGTGFSPISAQSAVVPEPSTYAAFFGLVALGVVACRRQRQGS